MDVVFLDSPDLHNADDDWRQRSWGAGQPRIGLAGRGSSSLWLWELFAVSIMIICTG